MDLHTAARWLQPATPASAAPKCPASRRLSSQEAEPTRRSVTRRHLLRSTASPRVLTPAPFGSTWAAATLVSNSTVPGSKEERHSTPKPFVARTKHRSYADSRLRSLQQARPTSPERYRTIPAERRRWVACKTGPGGGRVGVPNRVLQAALLTFWSWVPQALHSGALRNPFPLTLPPPRDNGVTGQLDMRPENLTRRLADGRRWAARAHSPRDAGTPAHRVQAYRTPPTKE